MDFLDNITISNDFLISLLKVATIIAVLIIIKYVGKTIITKIVRNAITEDKYSSAEAEKKREDTLITIFDAIIRTSIWIFGLMLVLAQLGINIGPLIAGASIAGIAIGFGAQKIVQDFVTGILIILENQYRIGDVVEIAGKIGTVENITIRQTIIRDAHGNKHFIANGQIDQATNYTVEYSNLIIDMDVAYEADIQKVQTVINEVGQKLAKDPQFTKDIINPSQFLRIQEFGAHSVVVRIQGKVKPGKQWSIAGELRLRLKKAFDANKIDIPYHQIVIHKSQD